MHLWEVYFLVSLLISRPKSGLHRISYNVRLNCVYKYICQKVTQFWMFCSGWFRFFCLVANVPCSFVPFLLKVTLPCIKEEEITISKLYWSKIFSRPGQIQILTLLRQPKMCLDNFCWKSHVLSIYLQYPEKCKFLIY